MKIQTELYGLVYKNHNGRFTRKPYQGFLFTSRKSAQDHAHLFAPSTKKNLKLAKVMLETLD